MRQRMFVVSALMPVWASVTQPAVAQPTQPPGFSADLARAVRRVMTAAADWRLAHPSEHPPYDWTVPAFYTGVMALAKLSDSPKYYDAMKAMGERDQWRPGLRPGSDDGRHDQGLRRRRAVVGRQRGPQDREVSTQNQFVI